MTSNSKFKSIFGGEMAAYFNSPIAYIFIVVFVMLTGILFMSNFFLIGNANMRYFFNILPIILCVVIPAITMRIWAEEKKGNTFELLLTFPMNSYKIVLGKFMASLVFYIIALAGTLFIPLMLIFIGKPDLGPIIGGYLGACFLGAFFLSVGIFISGLCKDQIIAFIVSMLVCFFFFLAGLDFMASSTDGWIPGLGTFLNTNFGMTQHLASFEKGVIDLKDILYFLFMTVSFLILNIFSIEDRMRPKAKVFFSFAVGVCLLSSMILNSLIFDIPMGRVDLTQGKIFTVTQSTKDILHGLKAPVNIKLYISPPDKMPTAFKSLEQNIKDRMEELKLISKGKLDYKILHMEGAGQAEQGKKAKSLKKRMQEKGIQPFQVKSVEQDEIGIKLIYSGMSIAYKEKEEEIIPQIIPRDLNNLEYILMSKIYRMTLDKNPAVALLAPYSEKALDPKMAALLRQLGQNPASQYKDDKYRILDALLHREEYNTSRIRLTKEVPLASDIKTLIIVEPEKLNKRQCYEINRFLYQGGNVIIAAQGYSYEYAPGNNGVNITPRKNQTGINKLIENYGVKISDKLLMDQEDEVISVSGGTNLGLFTMSTPVKVPMQIIVGQENMNQNVSITGRLSALLYFWGSALDLNKDIIAKNKLNQTILFTSSKESWTADSNGQTLIKKDITHSGDYQGKLALAVLLEGQFPNAYQGQPVPQWAQTNTQDNNNKKTEEKEPEQALTSKPGKLLVIGCSSMFEENFIQNGGALNLFINAVDALTLGDELINIRSHALIDRKIRKLSKMEKLFYRFLTIILIPLLIIILGCVRALFRKKEKEQYIRLLKTTSFSNGI